MRYIRVMTALALFAQACGDVTTDSKTSGALNQRTPVCQSYPKATLDALDAQLQGLKIFNGFTDAERPELLKHLYAVPPLYRDAIIARSKSGQFQGFFKANIDSSGVCYSSNSGCSRIELSASQQGVIEFSMIHEMGHGAKGAAVQASGLSSRDFDSQIEVFMEEGRTHNNSAAGKLAANKIRAYSLTDADEFWADSFHNYYCSPAAHDFIKTYLPKNYAFLQKILANPVWLDDTTGESTSGGTDAKAQTHIGDLVTLFNAASKTCDLEVGAIGATGATGDFKASLKLKSAEGTSDFVVNTNGSLASELSRLRRTMPALFPECPAE